MSRLLIALFLLPIRLRRLMGHSPAPSSCPDYLPDLYDQPFPLTTDDDELHLLNCQDWLEHCYDLDPASYKPRRRNAPDLNP